jgi:hypothetical protein
LLATGICIGSAFIRALRGKMNPQSTCIPQLGAINLF